MTTTTPQPATPSEAWSDLTFGEWAFRRGLLDDTELLHRRAAWRAATPAARTQRRWAQPTVAELRAAGDHAEADRILGLRTWYDTQRAQAHAEVAFDRLNPDFGVPADTSDPRGHQAVRDREAGLALGTRVAVAASRENDPTPPGRARGRAGLPGRRRRPRHPPAPPARAGRPGTLTARYHDRRKEVRGA